MRNRSSSTLWQADFQHVCIQKNRPGFLHILTVLCMLSLFHAHPVLITHSALDCACLVPSAQLSVAHEGFRRLLLSCNVPPHQSSPLGLPLCWAWFAPLPAVSGSDPIIFWCLDSSFSKTPFGLSFVFLYRCLSAATWLPTVPL